MKTTLFPYLGFNNNCKEAMEFYHSILGGELEIQTFGEVPNMPADDSTKDLVMHASLTSEDFSLFGSDAQSSGTVNFGNNITLCLGGTDLEGLTSIFNLLSEGGEIQQALKTEFWGDTFGMFKDKFGMCWMVNISKEVSK